MPKKLVKSNESISRNFIIIYLSESGRTSSVGNDILGFDSTGSVVNQPEHGNLDWVCVYYEYLQCLEKIY